MATPLYRRPPNLVLTQVNSQIADYELLTAADNSSVVRYRIANSVHQMREASGRMGHTAVLGRITEDAPGAAGRCRLSSRGKTARQSKLGPGSPGM